MKIHGGYRSEIKFAKLLSRGWIDRRVLKDRLAVSNGHRAARSNVLQMFISMPLMIKMFVSIETNIEKMKMTYKIQPNTIFEPMNEMTHFVADHREAKRSVTELNHL